MIHEAISTSATTTNVITIGATKLASAVRSMFAATLLLVFILGSGCSAFGGDDELTNLTGEWSGTITDASGQANGIVLTITHVGDEISGFYREYERLDNGNVLSTGGDLDGTAVSADRIEVLMKGTRLLQMSEKADKLFGDYTIVSRPSIKGSIDVTKR